MADIGLINAGLAPPHLARPSDVQIVKRSIGEVFFEVFSLRALTGLGGTV